VTEGSSGRGRGYRWTSLVETVLFIAVALVVGHLVLPDDPGYLSFDLHPFWTIVILASLRYGFREAVACAAVAALVHTWYIATPPGAVFHFSALSLFADFRDPLLYLVVAGVNSRFTQHLVERTLVLRRQLVENSEHTAELEEANRAASEALHQLESRIASELTSILDLFGELARTKQMTAGQIKAHLLEVLAEHIHSERGVVYDYERGRLVRRHVSGGAVDEGRAVNGEADVVLRESLRTADVVHLGQFTGDPDPEQWSGGTVLARALRTEEGEVLGVVGVEAMPFVDYHPHTFKLFGTIVEWWSRILDERLRLDELRSRSVYDEELGLYNYAYFANRMEQEFERARRFSLPISLCLGRVQNWDDISPERTGALRQTLARIVSECVTELDLVAAYRADDTLAVAFPISMAADAEARLGAIAEQIERFDFSPYTDGERRLAMSWSTVEYEIGMESFDEMAAKAEAAMEPGDADA